MTLRNSGAISQDGSISLNGTLLNDAGKTYTMVSPGDISSVGAGATVTNNGAFMVNSGGASRVSGTFTNTASAVLHVLAGSTLTLDGGTETLNGIVKGLGTLRIGGGGVATLNTTSVSVANLALGGGNGGAQLVLGTDLTYAGVLAFQGQFDTLRLNGHTLTLSGSGNSLLSSSSQRRRHAEDHGFGDHRLVPLARLGRRRRDADDAAQFRQRDADRLADAERHHPQRRRQDLHHRHGRQPLPNPAPAEPSPTTAPFPMPPPAPRKSMPISPAPARCRWRRAPALQLRGSNTLAGTLSGAGALVLIGNTSLDATTLSVGALTVGGGTTTLARNISYGGSFALAQAFATLALNGHTLTLTGTTAFTAGTVKGLDGATDTLAITGAAVDLSAVAFASWEAGDVITITGTDAANTLVGSSLRDTINGGGADDTLVGRGGADALIGGTGVDTASYAGGSVAVRADLLAGIGTGGEAEGDTYSSIENLIGTGLADTLIGNSAANRLEGGIGGRPAGRPRRRRHADRRRRYRYGDLRHLGGGGAGRSHQRHRHRRRRTGQYLFGDREHQGLESRRHADRQQRRQPDRRLAMATTCWPAAAAPTR